MWRFHFFLVQGQLIQSNHDAIHNDVAAAALGAANVELECD